MREPPRTTDDDTPEVQARIRECLPIADALAGQLMNQTFACAPLEELVSLAREGLVGAARSFDPSRGVPFRCWAAIRIRGKMFDGLRTMGRVPKRVYREIKAMEDADRVADTLMEEEAPKPIASAEDADDRLSKYLAGMATAMAVGLIRDEEQGPTGDAPSTPEEEYAAKEVSISLRAAIGKLPDAERALIERHYFHGATVEEACKELGLSKSWGSRLHARAIEAIGREMKRNKIKP
jgi:RNA polymerase sigma factor for flagellar operon FliA